MPQLQPFMDQNGLLTVINTLITSHLDYWNVLYIWFPFKKIQLVQNLDNYGTIQCTWMALLLESYFDYQFISGTIQMLVVIFKSPYSSRPGYLRNHFFYSYTLLDRSKGVNFLQDWTLFNRDLEASPHSISLIPSRLSQSFKNWLVLICKGRSLD